MYDSPNSVVLIHPSNENKTMRVIEWLIDNEQIRYVEGDRLEWLEK